MNQMPGPILFSAKEIESRIAKIANDIWMGLKQEKSLSLIGILEGGRPFSEDLCKAFQDLGAKADLHFIRLSSYGNKRHSSGVVTLLEAPDVHVKGKTVLIADDIWDSGTTMTWAKNYFLKKGAHEVITAVLLDKSEALGQQKGPDYYGFKAPASFVVGFGLDDAGKFRTLPDIHLLNKG